MVIDETLVLVRNSHLTGPLGTTFVGLALDLGEVPDKAGGNGLRWVVRLRESAMSSGSATARFHLVSDTGLDITPGTALKHFTSGWFTPAVWTYPGGVPVLTGDLVAGATVVSVGLPAGTFRRYLGVLIETTSPGFSSGSIHSFICADTPSRRQ